MLIAVSGECVQTGEGRGTLINAYQGLTRHGNLDKKVCALMEVWIEGRGGGASLNLCIRYVSTNTDIGC